MFIRLLPLLALLAIQLHAESPVFQGLRDAAVLPHGTAPIPVNASLAVVNVPAPALTPASAVSGQMLAIPSASGPKEKPVSPSALSFKWAMRYLVALTVLSGIIGCIPKKHRSRGARRPPSAARPVPPPLPAQSPLVRTSILPDSDPDARYRPPVLAHVEAEPDPFTQFQRRATVLTPAELAFYSALAPIVHPGFMISAKVRLADLFDARVGKRWQTAFNKISRKHIDFVLTDPRTSRILCAIELDDRSHQRPDRIERDGFVNQLFASHRLPLLRIPFARTYSAHDLRTKLAAAGLPVSVAA